MRFIEVTDDQGTTQWLNPNFILGIKPRVKSELGSVVRFSNGTTLNIIEHFVDVMRQIESDLCKPNV